MELDNKIVNNLRYLSATMITNAKSGHTGIALGSAPIFYALYKEGLKTSSQYPEYFNRDRLVLCAGHSTAIYYSCLHAFGYNYSMDDLKRFRSFGSVTPSHPEVDVKRGVESASGPLGQGVAIGVGMAIAEAKLSARFNKPNHKIINHHTIVFASDGSMMEGVANEALSIAGNLKLNNLIVIYDSNNLTIEGKTDLSFSENMLLGVQAQGWNTIEVLNGENIDEIVGAIRLAKTSLSKPTLIKVNTYLGFGSPLVDNEEIHGRALTEEELKQTKENLNVDCGKFEIKEEYKKYLSKIIDSHKKEIENEQKKVEEYKKLYKEEYAELLKWLDDGYSKEIDFKKIKKQTEDESTRESSGVVLKEIAKNYPNLITGSADLGPSTKVYIKERGDFSATDRLGMNLHFGLREHAMGAICNGIMLHKGFRVVCSTYMVFSDYMRHAIRMSAIMNLGVIYVFSHDSIGVGTDGRTHQPVEYNSIYRSTPNLNFFRPADRIETTCAYNGAFLAPNPSIMALSRDNIAKTNYTGENALKGGYFAIKHQNADAVLFSCGSELNIATSASEELLKQNIKVDVVSVMSSSELNKQPKQYKEKLLEKEVKVRVSIEASNDNYWFRFVGLDGVALGVDNFGFTATAQELYKHFKVTKEEVVKTIKNLLKK